MAEKPVVMNDRGSLNIPTSIFKNRTLSVLEAMVVYLKDKRGLNYAQIGRLLNRNDRTVWTCYKRALQKLVIDDNKKKKKNYEVNTRVQSGAIRLGLMFCILIKW